MARASSASAGERFPRRARLLAWLLAGACGLLPSAHATDGAVTVPPVDVTDGRISVGDRTVWLPQGAGHWVYIDHGEIPISGGSTGDDKTIDDRLVLVQVDHGSLVFGMELWMLRQNIQRSGWDFRPCDRQSDIYFKDYPHAPSLRECVSVRGQVATVFQQQLNSTAPGALAWLSQHKVALPNAVAKIRYVRFFNDTYGVVDLFVPANRFDSELATIAWAESVRTSLQPLFEHRASEAHLPPLPGRQARRPTAPASRPASR